MTRDWTVELWFKDFNPNGYNHPRARLVTKGDTAGPEVPYFVGVESNGLFVGLRSAGVPYVVRYDLREHGVEVNAWHHVAATLQGSTHELTLYLDGVRVARANVPTVSSGNTQPVSIGRSGQASGHYWKGWIDDVRVWQVARSGEQIAAAYHAELSGAMPGLVGNWKFDEGRGNTAADSAGSPQDATLNGGASWQASTPQ